MSEEANQSHPLNPSNTGEPHNISSIAHKNDRLRSKSGPNNADNVVIMSQQISPHDEGQKGVLQEQDIANCGDDGSESSLTLSEDAPSNEGSQDQDFDESEEKIGHQNSKDTTAEQPEQLQILNLLKTLDKNVQKLNDRLKGIEENIPKTEIVKSKLDNLEKKSKGHELRTNRTADTVSTDHELIGLPI